MSDHGIVIKSPEVLDNLLGWQYHSKLCALIKWVAENFGILITEGYRKKRHRNDVHGTIPVRAIDGRARIYKTNGIDAQKVADAVNKAWVYDPDRLWLKCAVFGDDNHQDHIHFQVHPKTIFKG